MAKVTKGHILPNKLINFENLVDLISYKWLKLIIIHPLKI